MSDHNPLDNVSASNAAHAINCLSDCIDRIFGHILDAQTDLFESNATILDQSYGEFRAALDQILLTQTQELTPTLSVSVEFLLGREDYNNQQIESALDHYQQSIELWPTPSTPDTIQSVNAIEKLGAVLFHMGLGYEQLGKVHSAPKNYLYWQAAQNHFQQCLDLFEQANRRDLIAKFIPPLCLVLRQLEAWDELQVAAQRSLDLHLSYGSHHQISQDYGFLAETAMHQSKWAHANQLAELAIEIQKQSVNDSLSAISHENPYLFLLAESKKELQAWKAMVSQLEEALLRSDPQQDTQTSLQILKALQKLYFEQEKYGKASHFKEEKLKLEYQLGLHSFVGLKLLQPPYKARSIQDKIASEIVLSERLSDLNSLVERIESDQHRLIVLHGESGVGKSSLIQAGIVPILLHKQAGDHQVATPITLRIYTDWLREPNSDTWNLELVLERLQRNSVRHLSTLLIFDQFEEFFVVCTDPRQRLPFYQFLRDCLTLESVTVLLAMRSDFLHYLLECDRLISLEGVIGCEILSKQVIYELTNFSPQQTKRFIEHQTKQSPLNFEPALLEQIIIDMATSLEEIRPIDLQLIGSYLQSNSITTLAQYCQLGKNRKQTILEYFLNDSLQDCGISNEKLAILVLYSLTRENHTRPLKTRAELAADLDVEAPHKLDLVLEVFVENGLVLLLPDIPEDRYQLAHDYLVPLIRQQKGERLIAELELERNKAQRKLIQEKPNSLVERAISSVLKWMKTD